MLCFVRRSPDLDNSKALHRKKLHDSIYEVLKKQLSLHGIIYSDNSVRFNKYGKPYLLNSDLYFNISHCTGLAVCAVDNCEIGVDVEHIRKFAPRVINRAFSSEEAEAVKSSDSPDETFFRLWTLKESYVKALGIGISYPLNTAVFSFDGGAIKASGCDGFSFRQFIINDSFICSLCLKRQINQTNSMTEKVYTNCDDFICDY